MVKCFQCEAAAVGSVCFCISSNLIQCSTDIECHRQESFLLKMSAVIGNHSGVAEFINWQGNFLFVAFRNWYKHNFSKIQRRPEHVGCGQVGFFLKKAGALPCILLYSSLLKCHCLHYILITRLSCLEGIVVELQATMLTDVWPQFKSVFQDLCKAAVYF